MLYGFGFMAATLPPVTGPLPGYAARKSAPGIACNSQRFRVSPPMHYAPSGAMRGHTELPLVRVGQGTSRRDYYPADIDSPEASAAMLAVCLLLCAFAVGVVVGWLLL
jgi:hypothetical protein